MLSQVPTDNIPIVGDFNMLLDPSLNRLFSDPATDSALSRWTNLFGLTNVWRWKHPTDRVYTGHSVSYNMLSHIDLIYASDSMLPKMNEVLVLPRGISDHSPIMCCLQTVTPPTDRLWCLSRFGYLIPPLNLKWVN